MLTELNQQNLFIFSFSEYIMELQKAIEKRASIKKFSMKKPPIELINKSIFAADLAPSAGNMQLITYLIIENKETIGKITDACQQEFIRKAPYVVVVVSDPKRMNILYDKRAEKYMKHNVGAAVENFLLKITDEGLAACWVGAFVEELIKSILKIPGDKEVEVIIPIGYEEIEGRAKQKLKRYPVNRVFFETWGNRFYKPLTKIRRSDM